MDTENKHPDSANDSVDSFEDAIDHLEMVDDAKTSSKSDYSFQTTDLNFDSAPVSSKNDSTQSVSEATINSTVFEAIVKESEMIRDIKVSSESLKQELPINIESKIENGVHNITSNLADIDINPNKLKPLEQLVSHVTPDSKEKMEESTNVEIPVNVTEEGKDKITSSDTCNEEKEEESTNVDIPVNIREEVKTEVKEVLIKISTKEGVEEVSLNEEIVKIDSKVEEATQENQSKESLKEGQLRNEISSVDNEQIANGVSSLDYDTNIAITKPDLIIHCSENKNKEESESKNEDFENNDKEDGSIHSERECGDGQGEQDEAQKELDHDEDKRNPEYIPKKGSFYEHDTRTMDGFDDDVRKIEEESTAKSKKKAKPVSSESRWEHDKYDELEQGPKSHQEIIDTYGYDIRNEEHPPKPRRNRRYGRGPNKYNRNWEDEKAYIKIENKPRTPGGRGQSRPGSDRRPHGFSGSDTEHHGYEREEFPPLSRIDNNAEKRAVRQHIVDKAATPEKAAPIHYSDKIGMKAEKGAWVPPPPFSQKNVVNKNSEHNNKTQSNVVQREQSPKANEKTSQPTSKAFAPLNTASFTPLTITTPVMPHGSELSGPNVKGPRSKQSETGLIRPIPNWEPGNWYINQNKVESGAPPDSPDLSHKDYSKLTGAGVASLRGGKRYSVQRQQSLPESVRVANTPGSYGKISPVPVGDGDTNIPGDGQNLAAYYHHPPGTAPPITVPQSSPSHLVFTQSPPPPSAAPPLIKGDFVNLNLNAETPIYHSNSFQPAPVYSAEPSHPISNGAPVAPPMLLPVHFVSPPPAQVPAFNTTQTPIMSFGPQPMQFQAMRPIVSLPPPPQTEVFQPSGGITYYSPQTQAVLQRPALSKRVNSAIPIVPPNEVNNMMQQNNQIQQANLIQGQIVPNNLIQSNIVQMVPVEINKEEPINN